MFVSPCGVRSNRFRNDLVTFRKRLKASEAKMVPENLMLTEEEFRALEKAKDEVDCGNRETHKYQLYLAI